MVARNAESSALVTRPEEERAIVVKEEQERVTDNGPSQSETRADDKTSGVPQQNGNGTSDPELRRHVKTKKSSSDERKRSKSRERSDNWRKESGSVVSTERGSETTDSPRYKADGTRINPTDKSPARARAGAASLKPQDNGGAQEVDLMKGAERCTLLTDTKTVFSYPVLSSISNIVPCNVPS